MQKEIWKIDDEMRSIKYDEKCGLCYVEIDGQAYSAESLDELEIKLRKSGHTVFRYPRR
jgi:hypothetical protein